MAKKTTKRLVSGMVQVKDLIEILKRIENKDAYVMLSADPEGNAIADLDENFTIAKRNGSGEIIDEMSYEESDDDDILEDVIVLWPTY